MMMMNINRRTALFGVGASTLALAAPIASSVASEPEHPWVRARRAARELATALEEIEHHPVAGGKQVAIVEPSAVWFADYDEYYSRTYLTDDDMSAIAAWQQARKDSAAALKAFMAKLIKGEDVPLEDPLRAAWIDADEAAMQAQFRLLDMLEEYAASGRAAQ